MQFALMAGPCSVESEEQLLSTAHAGQNRRGEHPAWRAYKPRTSPYEFQGLGKEGLRLLALAKEQTGLKIITEILSEVHVEHVAEVADILQVGARNAQNFQLLIACAKSGKPVLLKRGLSERIDEWLLAAEYLPRAWKWKRPLLRKRYPHFRNVHAQHTRPGRRRRS
jgi:3-deoxy-7-phosphoheptulonate synthase